MEKLDLVVRIHDASHNNEHDDRFNQTFTLEPGEHVIKIPVGKIESTRSGRKLQLGKMRVIMLYLNRPKEEYTLYFDNFRLE
jgi:hypothetical protein